MLSSPSREREFGVKTQVTTHNSAMTLFVEQVTKKNSRQSTLKVSQQLPIMPYKWPKLIFAIGITAVKKVQTFLKRK